MHDTRFYIHHHTIIIPGPRLFRPTTLVAFYSSVVSVPSNSNSNFIAYNGDLLLHSTDANKYSLYIEYISLLRSSYVSILRRLLKDLTTDAI